MKKRIHILTIRDHRKMMVEPGANWYKEIWSGKYSERFHYGAHPLAPSEYNYFVADKDSIVDFGSEIAYFNDFDAAGQWCKQKNAEFPTPPKPDPPPPPLPLGTYYILEARYYELRQMTRQTKSGVQTFLGNEWEQPYPLVSGPGDWQEKFIAKYDDRDEALAHLQKLIQKRSH